MNSHSSLVMDVSQLNKFLADVFPQVKDEFQVESLTLSMMTTRMFIGEQHLRPGGTISGPAMFSLADVSIYLLTISRIGPKALAVTTNISMDFMRKPQHGRDLIAHSRLLKLGHSLSVGDTLIFSDKMTEPVARASMTYSIPPSGSKSDINFI